MNYEVAWLLEIAAYCAVNCYAIISGYVSYETKFKYSRIISLWFQVIFYTVIITVGFAIFMSEVVGIKDIVKAFMPTITNQYWYFSAYFGMFFFIPFFNYLLKNLEKRKMTILIITIFFLFSIVSTISRYTVFSLGGGYSMVWLSALYLLGGYIKKYGVMEKIKVRWLVVIYLISILITWSSRFVMEVFTSKVLGRTFGGGFLVNYLSPTILIAGVSLVILFAKLEIHSKIIAK